MGYRTLEISSSCEIHIKEGQLEVTSDSGSILIPIEDLSQIMVHGANIRLSTMDLSILSRNKVSLMTLDEKYLATAIVLPFEGHARQSKLMHAQVLKCSDIYLDLWVQIINRKVSNQARALSIMGMNGAENISKYLTDDLIEPYRAIVDIVAHNNIGSNIQLSKNERREIAHVLHNACMIDGAKVNVMSAIDMMVESLKRIILDDSDEKLILPIVFPIESMEGITE